MKLESMACVLLHAGKSDEIGRLRSVQGLRPVEEEGYHQHLTFAKMNADAIELTGATLHPKVDYIVRLWKAGLYRWLVFGFKCHLVLKLDIVCKILANSRFVVLSAPP